MTWADALVVVCVLCIIGAAVFYIRKEKKQGRCVGCPYAKECAAKKKGTGTGTCGGCQSQEESPHMK